MRTKGITIGDRIWGSNPSSPALKTPVFAGVFLYSQF